MAKPTQKSRMLRAYSLEEDLESGLGEPPAGITAASSYLLFNSSTNPYRSHRKFDPLDAPTRRVAEDTEPNNLLEDAPASLGSSELVNRLVPKSYSYWLVVLLIDMVTIVVFAYSEEISKISSWKLRFTWNTRADKNWFLPAARHHIDYIRRSIRLQAQIK